MATYARENAEILKVYRRRTFPSGKEKYIKQPWNLVTYDDQQQFVEPVSFQVTDAAKTWYDTNNDNTDGDWLIIDASPFDGVTEIR
jgi:hypothetical protein